MECRIKDFEDYSITTEGRVISYKYGEPRIMSTWYQKSGYENIVLSKNNKTYHKLVHRLVAEAFLPNPKNLPEVNHKDNNPKNNKVENLEWCDRKYNLEQSYLTMSPVRNFKKCYLFKGEDNLGEFQSKVAAARVAEKFGASYSGILRNGKSKG